MNKKAKTPDHTAIRTALWRSLHVHIDPPPHILNDTLGEKLVAEENWRSRPDMDPAFSKNMRASIVGRARFIEDLVQDEMAKGVEQYVILGAGLDTYALRRPDLEGHLHIYEIDHPATQMWKQNRLTELGIKKPSHLHFVPVDFEANESWPAKLRLAGLDVQKPCIIVSTGLTMYLTLEAIESMFSQVAQLAPGSTFATTFMLSLELLEEQERAIMELVMTRARSAGTPFLSLFTPDSIMKLAVNCGFKKAQCVSGEDLYQRYFVDRTDNLKAGNAEAFLVAQV